MKPLQLQTERFCLPRCSRLETPALCRVSQKQKGPIRSVGAAELHQVLQDGKLNSQFLIQKKWFHSGFFQLLFPLQTPLRVLAGSDWLLTFRSSAHSPVTLPGTDPNTAVKAAGHPLTHSLAESPWLGFHVALPWQNRSERRFLTSINPRQHPREYFYQIIPNL